jgi:hypothetical protein
MVAERRLALVCHANNAAMAAIVRHTRLITGRISGGGVSAATPSNAALANAAVAQAACGRTIATTLLHADWR